MRAKVGTTVLVGLLAMALCAGTAQAAEINSPSLGTNGWYSDDTRADGSGVEGAGTNLINTGYTDDPEGTAGPQTTLSDMLEQIMFGAAPAGLNGVPTGTHLGACQTFIDAVGGGSGKSQISHRKDDGIGHAAGSVLSDPGFFVDYTWMGDGPSTFSCSFKIGFKTAEFGTAVPSSRTGENVWDKLLIFEPNHSGPNNHPSDGNWYAEHVTRTGGTWWVFDRLLGYAGQTQYTLAAMQTSTNLYKTGNTKTIADIYALCAAGHITTVQFGVGSGNAGASVHVNQLATSFYRVGDTTTFGPTPTVQNIDTGEWFVTIQAAIDDADTLAGHTLEVVADLNEGLVHVDKDLTIQGGSVHTIYATTDTGSDGDARGWFLVDAAVELNVQDLNFDGNGHLIYQGFRHKGEGTFTNCGFNDLKYNESGPTYGGVAIAAFGGGPVNVTGCTFEEIGRVGVLYWVNGAFSGNTYTGKGSGDWLDYALDINAGAIVTISDSTITQCRGVASSDGSTSAGILLTTYYGSGTVGTITNCFLNGNTTGAAVGYDASDTTVVTILDSDLSGNADGGVGQTGTVTTDASGNWWGDLDPSDDLSGSVDYTPWLAVGTDTDLGTAGFQGDFATLWVDDDSPQTGSLGYIGEALGLVSGSTINVAAGTYTEPAQLLIDEDLTLIGAGKDVTTLMLGFDTTTGSYDLTAAFIRIDDGVTATIEDLAIDGSGRTVRHAIQSRGADLTVRGCDISNISSGDYAGRGIVYLTGTGLVEDCTMSNIGRIGVHIRGAIEPVAPDVLVDGLTYVGKGVGLYLDYGVEFGGGGVGAVTNSHITECRGIAYDDSTSAAILATDYYGTGTDATVTYCTLTDNYAGIYAGYAAGDLTVLVANNNNISGNSLGMLSVTAATVDAENNYWGDISGPEDTADDAGETEELGDCTGTPEAEFNADGLGNGVVDTSTEAVDYCPWLTPRLYLQVTSTDPACYSTGVGLDTVTVEIVAEDFLDTILGGQFNLEYDESVLTFTGASPGLVTFTRAVDGPYDPPGDGEVFYSVGIEDGASGYTNTAPIVMASLTFTTLLEACDVADLVTLEVGAIPYITRLTKEDANGNGVPLYAGLLLDLGEIRIDWTGPAVTPPTDTELECSTELPAAEATIAGFLVLPGADASDICTAQDDLAVSSTTGALVGDECSGTITRTYRITDECGNWTDVNHVFNVSDDTDPWFQAGTFPADVTQNADAGLCTAVIVPAIVSPTGVDNCDPAPLVTYERSDDSLKTLTDPFPTGDTTITWTVTDICGEFYAQDQTVTVLEYNNFIVDIEIEGDIVAGGFTRCITFTFYETCPDSSPLVFEKDMDFTFDNVRHVGVASALFYDLPCSDTGYTCVTAQDDLHTLLVAVTPAITGTNYVADFMDTNMLLQGDYYDDIADWGVDFIDIVDFGVFITEYGANYDSDTPPDGFDGNTPCGVFAIHADADGDSAVDATDYAFITANYMVVGDYPCCYTPAPLFGPRSSITVRELRAMGLSHVAAADLNNDGVVDMDDVALFMEGGVPDDDTTGFDTTDAKATLEAAPDNSAFEQSNNRRGIGARR